MNDSVFEFITFSDKLITKLTPEDIEFMQELFALFTKYGTYTMDGDYSPESFWWPIGENGRSLTLQCRIDEKKEELEIWHQERYEHAPFSKLSKRLYEKEINDHYAYMETTKYGPHSPTVSYYTAVSKDGIRQVATLSHAYNSDGNYVSMEKDIPEQ